MNLIRPSLAAAVPVLAALAHMPAAHAQAPTEPPRRIVLLVDEIKQIRSFPVVLAERLGYFKADGMDVTVMNIRDDVSKDTLLMDGRVDAVMAYYHHNIVNRSKGVATQAVVTLGVTPGAKVLVSNAARDRYKTTADLKGSRFIAGGAGSSKSTVANYLLLEGGHGLADYTRLGTDGKEKNVEALRSGTADFVVAPVPDGRYYEAKGVAGVWADLTTKEGTRQFFGALFPSNTVYMAADRVAAHPEIAQHLANAFVKTLRYINSHSAEEIAALMPPEVVGKDRAEYLKTLKDEMPMFATDGRMPADGAEKEWKVLTAANPAYAPVKTADTYTNVFVERALAAK